ncbi:MAG: histidine triad nucleotide-binding protein [Candidatus Xiphinematobacter sp.]|nr:MAG: histidine triad nucleotide-binding protein [Candidatus Xiphinematobacter sp.]
MGLFEEIISRKIPAKIVWEDSEVLAFRDIQPQAPVHILIVPKETISGLTSAEKHHVALLGKLLLVAAHLAESENVSRTGFRLVINSGLEGGQAVSHLHVHLLGGRPFSWPPG